MIAAGYARVVQLHMHTFSVLLLICYLGHLFFGNVLLMTKEIQMLNQDLFPFTGGCHKARWL